MYQGSNLYPKNILCSFTQKRQPIITKIKLMDGTDKAFLIDSASTVGEIIEPIVDRIMLMDANGFGLFEVYNNIGSISLQFD
jgi:hypothetical protein